MILNRRTAKTAAIVAAVLLTLTPISAQAGPVELPAPAVAQAVVPETKVFMSIGDSISETGEWQDELCRLMLQDANIDCDIRNEAVGGTSCLYWTLPIYPGGPIRINHLLATHQPDIVALACGTNDSLGATIWGESETTWSWRYTMEAIHAYNANTAQLAVLIQYSDPKTAPQWVLDTQPTTNDRIYVEYLRHQSWFAIADWQYVPATATYLDAGGLHPTDQGEDYMGRIAYDALATKLGWPATLEPALCDLYGHRRGYARPSFTGC